MHLSINSIAPWAIVKIFFLYLAVVFNFFYNESLLQVFLKKDKVRAFHNVASMPRHGDTSAWEPEEMQVLPASKDHVGRFFQSLLQTQQTWG